MVLDIEVASSNASLHSAQDVASWSKDFVDAVCSLANVPPSRVFIYTGAWFWYLPCLAPEPSCSVPHAAVGTLRPAAAACVQTILCGSAATLPLLPCPADGRTGRFGSTRTRPPSLASAAASIAPTFTAPARSSPHGRNAAAVPLPEALALLWLVGGSTSCTRGESRPCCVHFWCRNWKFDVSSQSKLSAESDAKQRFLFNVQCA